MSTYLVGFGRRKGEFANDKTGELISYDNRLLRCVTDDGKDKDNFGFMGFEVKMKMADVADSLGVSENGQSVDSSLNNLCRKEIELIYAPRNNVMTVVGFRPVLKKS